MNITYQTLPKETEEIIELLQDTVWGLKGPLFSHKEVAHRIRSNPKNHFFCAFHEAKLVGTLVCCERQVQLGSISKVKGVYTRYFSVLEKYRGQKIGETLLSKAEKYFENKFATEPVIYYAYQDKKNTASMKVAENKNFHIYSDFQTFTFSRIKPLKTVSVSELNLEELKTFATIKNTCHFQPILGTSIYGVKNNLGETICSARFLPSSWNIVRIPGWQGVLMKYVISYLPYLNRLFNRRSFDFLAVDHLFISPNCTAKQLSCFLESVLAMHNQNIMLLWSDHKDSNYMKLQQIPNPGLLEKLNGNVPACIRVEHRNLNENQIKSLEEQPFFICSPDLT